MRPSSGSSSSGCRRFSMDRFSPVGLHVLVVDDDPLCLMVLDRMLRQCNYKVTTCNRVNRALELLRENKEDFNLVMSDVYMPDEDGFKLLEVIGLELDLPVIMMSANGETSVVMKGITHGACDYLIKPVRMEELRNIWQHVIRKKGKDSPRIDDSGRSSAESQEQSSKKRKEVDEMVDDMVDDVNSLKKARVNWSVQLHQQFVNSVNQLGVDKAVPKKILEIMSVQGLTRENVASHLQKYRLYLKRLSGVVPEPCPIASFQASDDGTGGTMLIQPGGKSPASNPAVKGLNLGAGISSASAGRSIDPGTMKALAQFKSSQQKQAANRAQVLGGLGLVDEQRPIAPGSLQRMASLDLSFFMKAQQADMAADVLDDLAANSLRSVKLEDDGQEVSRRSQRRQAATEGLIARWNINPGLDPQDGRSDEANVHRRVSMEAIQESRPATARVEIADDMSSTNLPHALSPSAATELSGEGLSETSFDALGDLSAVASVGHLMPNSVLDITDYLVLDDVFLYRN